MNAQNLSPNSTGSFTYTPQSPLENQTVEVFYHIPDGDISTMPILMSFHGAGRNADDYRDYWINIANANNFMVFAPEFSQDNFPGGDRYQLANIFDDGDNPSPSTFNNENEWTFSIIDPLFEIIKADISGIQEVYDAWGHSGGAQFLHRFVTYLPNSQLNMAVCSNAGWYTVPEFSIDFPYGLQSSELANNVLISAFSKKLIVHLGQDDTDPNAPGLRHNMVVDDQQGTFRLERGQYYFETSQTTAENLNADFNWEKHEIANIGHQAHLMANDAFQYLALETLSVPSNDFIKFRIYPNPSETNIVYVTFTTNNLEKGRAIIFDTSGKIILDKELDSHHLDVSHLNSGIYFLKISQGSNSQIKKLIIK